MQNKLVQSVKIKFIICYSIIFAQSIQLDLGDDYGFYFVGSRSLDTDYSLYSAWFDNKGPFFYIVTKIISSFLPYSLAGAKIYFGLIILFYLSSAIYFSKKLKLTYRQEILLILILSASLIKTPTNGVVGIFMAAIVIMFLGSFLANDCKPPEILKLSTIFLLVLANLTRPDSFTITLLSVILIIVNKKRPFIILADFAIKYCLLFIVMLITMKYILHFTLRDFFYNNFYFSLFIYPRYELGGMPDNFSIYTLWRPSSIKVLLITGLFIYIVLPFYLYAKKKIDSNLLKSIFIILGFGILPFLMTNSDKNYFLLILIPNLVVIAGLLLKQNLISTEVKYFSFIFAVISITISIYFHIKPTECSLSTNKCTNINRIEILLNYEKIYGIEDSDFYLGSAWPYMFKKIYPKIDFSPTVPLNTDIGPISLKTKTQIIESMTQYIWINKKFRERVGSDAAFGEIASRNQIILGDSLSSLYENGLELWVKKRI